MNITHPKRHTLTTRFSAAALALRLGATALMATPAFASPQHALLQPLTDIGYLAAVIQLDGSVTGPAATARPQAFVDDPTNSNTWKPRPS